MVFPWRSAAIGGSILSGTIGVWIGANFGDHVRNRLHGPFALAAASNLDVSTAPNLPAVIPAPPSMDSKSAPTIASRVSEIMKFGYPGYEHLRTFEDFVLSYDRRNRSAYWVFEHLSPERMVYDPSVDRSKCQFREDNSIHPYFRSSNDDYKASGFDRGHLAAAGNHRKTQNSVDQTFLLTNMAPQVGKGFNRDKWNDLEKHVRKLARKSKNVYVCTGPLYLPQQNSDGKMYVTYRVIGRNNVSVPTHFFKVALIERTDGNYELESYVLPNRSIDDRAELRSFYAPMESIERAAGFLIFEKLTAQVGNKLKSINGFKR
jgi:endonuclease G